MKADYLRAKSIEELNKLANELRAEIQQILVKKSLNKLKQPHLLKKFRRDLARVITIINEKKNNR